MTSIFVIYKIRNSQGVAILARLVESWYDKEACKRAIVGYHSILSSSEKTLGWEFRMEEVQILDTLETSPS